jgi:competence protein ComGC
MNKKGFGGLYMMFVLLIIGIIWITGLAPWLTQIGVVAVANGSTGLDGFFFVI